MEFDLESMSFTRISTVKNLLVWFYIYLFTIVTGFNLLEYSARIYFGCILFIVLTALGATALSGIYRVIYLLVH
jgi:hypothetical protein